MPRYDYRCRKCKKTQTIGHMSDEVADTCLYCGTEQSLVKLVAPFRIAQKNDTKQKLGEVTEEFIADSRAALAQQKDQLQKKR